MQTNDEWPAGESTRSTSRMPVATLRCVIRNVNSARFITMAGPKENNSTYTSKGNIRQRSQRLALALLLRFLLLDASDNEHREGARGNVLAIDLDLELIRSTGCNLVAHHQRAIGLWFDVDLCRYRYVLGSDRAANLDRKERCEATRIRGTPIIGLISSRARV